MTCQWQDIYAKEEYLLSVEGMFLFAYGDTVKQRMVLLTIASDVTEKSPIGQKINQSIQEP